MPYFKPNAGGGSGGSIVTTATQNISAGGTVTITASDGFQYVRVQSSGGTAAANVVPFSTTPADGTMIIICGQSDTNSVTFANNDSAGGMLLNGNATLWRASTLSVVYDSTLTRYVEIARSDA